MFGRWFNFSGAELNAMEAAHRKAVLEMWRMFNRNRLAFFLPHCDGLSFLNDRENDIGLLTKGNQQGGTAHGVA